MFWCLKRQSVPTFGQALAGTHRGGGGSGVEPGYAGGMGGGYAMGGGGGPNGFAPYVADGASALARSLARFAKRS